MQTLLLRKIASLIAGAALLLIANPARAAFPEILSINWPAYPNDTQCTVSVNGSPSSPYVTPTDFSW
jgi:hypothetical protein